jgi:hypothetical protein
VYIFHVAIEVKSLNYFKFELTLCTINVWCTRIYGYAYSVALFKLAGMDYCGTARYLVSDRYLFSSQYLIDTNGDNTYLPLSIRKILMLLWKIWLLEIEICKEFLYKIESTLDLVIFFISIFIIINQFCSLQNMLKFGFLHYLSWFSSHK